MRTRLQVMLDEAVIDSIREVADARGCSMSSAAGHLIQLGLKHQAKAAPPLKEAAADRTDFEEMARMIKLVKLAKEMDLL